MELDNNTHHHTRVRVWILFYRPSFMNSASDMQNRMHGQFDHLTHIVILTNGNDNSLGFVMRIQGYNVYKILHTVPGT